MKHRRRRRPHCCIGCGDVDYLPALNNPGLCYRCGSIARLYYGWRSAPFGRIRKIPPLAALDW